MSRDRSKRSCRSGRHVISALLLLALFSLPLHVHSASATSAFNQECSCYCGGRTQLGFAPVLSALIPIYNVVLFHTSRAETIAPVLVESAFARAPPFSV
jgi:hypothetical protein